MTETLVKEVLDGYLLQLDGVHGLRHWGRVLENGRKLAKLTGADLQIIELFALFHDCRRVNDGTDPGHGQRASSLAEHLFRRGSLEISDHQLVQLQFACDFHTGGLVDADTTVQTCWDADRLDLARVNIMPRPAYLCTEAAKDPLMIKWAVGRSRNDHQTQVAKWWLSLTGQQ